MKKKILAVDDNKALLEMLKEYFSSSKEVELVKTLNDGESALEEIRNNHDNYDLVLLDLIMPKKDGLYVLENLKKDNININIIVLTSYNEQETIRNISELGIKYMMLKPFDLKELEKRIIDVINNNGRKNVLISDQTVKIAKILHDLGIPSHIKGYQYIREAITLVYNDPSLIGGITKELYPRLAKSFETSSSRVERAIRHAIEVSWNRGDWDLMEEIFGHSVDIDRAKPTNSEFIVTIADKLKLDKVKVRQFR